MTPIDKKSRFLRNIRKILDLRQDPEDHLKDTLSIVIDALNSTVGGLIITGVDGKIQFVNRSFCNMFEYGPEEILGKDAADLFATKEVHTFADVLSIIDISKDETEEFLVNRSDNRQLTVEVSAANVTSSKGAIVGRMASFVDISGRKAVEADREKLIGKLQDALKKIKTLRGILPICANCKKIRDDQGYWNHLESYIRDHSEADFSHSICPACIQILYPEFETGNNSD